MIKETIDYPFLQYGELEIEYIGNRKWKVLKDFKFAIDKTNEVITIPKGFISDLASVPNSLRSIFPRSPKLILPSVVHDYLYSIGYEKRKICDSIFKETMLIVGIVKNKAKIFYSAVRVFGAKHYKKDDNV